jgi:hypothetical protein
MPMIPSIALVRNRYFDELSTPGLCWLGQNTYHTQRFGDHFAKVSTSAPSLWVEKFCTLLPEMVTQARTLNDLPPQF